MVDHPAAVGHVRPERFDVVVIGAGQAGLAVGYWLSRTSWSFVIVDAASEIGDSWRQRWDSLRLFTPACFDALPGLPFPADPDAYPTKDQMADYLAQYAERFRLPIRLGTPVNRIWRSGTRYVVATAVGHVEADRIIVATGTTGTPRVPGFAAELDPAIVQMTSADYRSPDQLRDGPTLLVGAGNSGAEIAVETSRRGSVALAGRSAGEVPAWIGCRGYRLLQRIDAEGWVGRRLISRLAGRGDPLVRVHEADLRAAGIRRLPRVVGARDGMPALQYGASPVVANVVWCTGFDLDLSWIDIDVGWEAGAPSHRRGVALSEPGLAFVGLRFQSSMTSHLVGGVGHDARFVVDRLVRR